MNTDPRIRVLQVDTAQGQAGTLHHQSQYVFNYKTDNPSCQAALGMPLQHASYAGNQLPGAFTQNLPEGYLLQRLQAQLGRYEKLTDMRLLALLGNRQIGRLQFHEQSTDVGLRRALGNSQQPADFRIRETLPDKAEHFHFTAGNHSVLAARRQQAGDVFADGPATGMALADGFVLRVHRQVGGAADAAAGRSGQRAKHDARRRWLGPGLVGGRLVGRRGGHDVRLRAAPGCVHPGLPGNGLTLRQDPRRTRRISSRIRHTAPSVMAASAMLKLGK